MKEIFLLRGIPGSGKSTLAESLGGYHVEADMFFNDDNDNYNFNVNKIKEAHNWCQNMVEEWMDEGVERIVVSNTFTQEWEMSTYYKFADTYGYRVYSLIVENRHGGKNIHNVPPEVINNMRSRFELIL